MKKPTMMQCFTMTVTAMLFSSGLWAQNQASPADTARGKAGGANITIYYSSPGVKGRKIWGGLVPYDKVWRAGANAATIFETDKDIKVEGKALKAGKYSLYAIPGEKEWTFIFNTQTGQWGIKQDESTSEDPAKDALRVTVQPGKAKAMQERMKYVIDKNGFALVWENLSVPVSIK